MGLYFKSPHKTLKKLSSWYIFNAAYGSGRFETDKIPRSDYGYKYLKGRIEFNFRIMYEAFLSALFGQMT